MSRKTSHPSVSQSRKTSTQSRKTSTQSRKTSTQSRKTSTQSRKTSHPSASQSSKTNHPRTTRLSLFPLIIIHVRRYGESSEGPYHPWGRAHAPACACPTAWADEVHRAGQICRKTGRTARHTEPGGQLPTLPTPPTLPRFPPFPRVSYCQQERHTRTLQNGLLSSHFTIPRFAKTLHTDTQQLTRRLNIMFII